MSAAPPAVIVYLLLLCTAASTAPSVGASDGADRVQAAAPADGFGVAPPRHHPRTGIEFDETLPYHSGEKLLCSDCHVMVRIEPTGTRDRAATSRIGRPQATAEGDSGSPRALPRMLLKSLDPVELCLSCHDGRTDTPDVVGSDINNLDERSAGHFSEPFRSSPRGHNLGHVAGDPDADGICNRCHGKAPGERRVTCIDCHAHHGNDNPRNLKWAASPEETPPLGLFNPPGIKGLQRYERDYVAYGTLNSSKLRELSSLCLSCHHTLVGEQRSLFPSARGHTSHPSYDSQRGDLNSVAQGAGRGTTDPSHWSRGTGSGFDGTRRVPFVVPGAADYASASAVEPSTNGVFCLTCHKAHGSDSAFGLTWKLNGAVGRRGCDQCHAIKPLASGTENRDELSQRTGGPETVKAPS